MDKSYRFLEYSPVKLFSNFLQSSVSGHRQEDKNPNSSVVAELMKLLANSSNDYQITDRSRHSVTTYMKDEKTHAASNDNLFNRLGHINGLIWEIELTISETEHKEPIFLGFFVLQDSKLITLELFYNFFTILAVVISMKRWEWMPIHCIQH